MPERQEAQTVHKDSCLFRSPFKSLLSFVTYCPPHSGRFPDWKALPYDLEAACGEKPRCIYELLDMTRIGNVGPHRPTSIHRYRTPLAKCTFSPPSIDPVHINPLLLHPTGKAPRDAPWALPSQEAGSPAKSPRKAAKPQHTPPRLLGEAAGSGAPVARGEAGSKPGAAPSRCSQPPRADTPPSAAVRGPAGPRRSGNGWGDRAAPTPPARGGDTPIHAQPLEGAAPLLPPRHCDSPPDHPPLPTPSGSRGEESGAARPGQRRGGGPLPRGYLPGTSCAAAGGRSSPPRIASPAPASAPAPEAAAGERGRWRRRPHRAGAVERPPWCYRCSAARSPAEGEAWAPGATAGRACAMPAPPRPALARAARDAGRWSLPRPPLSQGPASAGRERVLPAGPFGHLVASLGLEGTRLAVSRAPRRCGHAYFQ